MRHIYLKGNTLCTYKYAKEAVEHTLKEHGEPLSFIHEKDSKDNVLLIYPDKFIATGYDGEYQFTFVYEKNNEISRD